MSVECPSSFVSSGFAGPVSERIRHRLTEVFNPLAHLEIHNESHMHSAGQESHFKLVVVSSLFAGKPNDSPRLSFAFCMGSGTTSISTFLT
jgi:hypothetical protein